MVCNPAAHVRAVHSINARLERPGYTTVDECELATWPTVPPPPTTASGWLLAVRLIRQNLTPRACEFSRGSRRERAVLQCVIVGHCQVAERGMVILVWRPGGETNAQGHCYVVVQTYLVEKNQSKWCSHLPRALFTPFFFWQHPEGQSQPPEPPAPPSAPRGQSLPA